MCSFNPEAPLYKTIQWSLYFKTTLDYKTTGFGPKGQFSVLNDLCIKTNCKIRPHFLGPMGGLKIEGPLYSLIQWSLRIKTTHGQVVLILRWS